MKFFDRITDWGAVELPGILSAPLLCLAVALFGLYWLLVMMFIPPAHHETFGIEKEEYDGR